MEEVTSPEGTLTPDPIATPDPTPAAPETKTEPVPTGEPALTPAAPAFTPNYKYKVLDKELEIEEAYRGIMKDADSEKKVRELHEKAMGLEPVKAQRDEFRTKYRESENNYKQTQDQISDLRSTYQRGDIDQFLQKLNIPHERMLQWAYEKVKYSELPPEQRQVLDRQQAAERQVHELQTQTQSQQQIVAQQLAQAKAESLDVCLARPDIKAVQETFDSLPGRKPGEKFRDLVTEYGHHVWQQSQGKINLSADDAAKAVIERYGLSAIKAPAPAPTGDPVPTLAAPKPPIIPNVAGSAGSSPVKETVKSTSDLRAEYKRKFGS